MKTMRHNPGKTNHTQTHAKGKQNNKTSELVISIDIEFYVFEKARKNKQIYENYKIHVIFAYYYKTILLSFINKRKTRERDTQIQKTKHTNTPRAVHRKVGTNHSSADFFQRHSHFPLRNNRENPPFCYNQTCSIYRKTKKKYPQRA
uniref:(northern house mosquito) hypothetical protein n=1 Tax=Culex pipiens TaxID=7175 RepID=A0A8D8NPE8_CULPI